MILLLYLFLSPSQTQSSVPRKKLLSMEENSSFLDDPCSHPPYYIPRHKLPLNRNTINTRNITNEVQNNKNKTSLNHQYETHTRRDIWRQLYEKNKYKAPRCVLKNHQHPTHCASKCACKGLPSRSKYKTQCKKYKTQSESNGKKVMLYRVFEKSRDEFFYFLTAKDRDLKFYM
uniref:Uncharacterized protein n=1 Tax=Cacopsylla melanoneura TaxID=428564 RepID=A0A8D9E960_9HEMI